MREAHIVRAHRVLFSTRRNKHRVVYIGRPFFLVACSQANTPSLQTASMFTFGISFGFMIQMSL